jgi:cytosine deaminase
MANGHGRIAKGSAARLIVFNARSLNEVVSRPHSDRLLIREGRALVCDMPDYEELDFVRAAMDFPRAAAEKEPAQVAAE